jgi:hypothetical protein
VRGQTVDFYRDLVQDLKPPRPSTPKLPDAQVPDKPKPPESPPEAHATEGQVRREHGLGLENIAGLLREVNP